MSSFRDSLKPFSQPDDAPVPSADAAGVSPEGAADQPLASDPAAEAHEPARAPSPPPVPLPAPSGLPLVGAGGVVRGRRRRDEHAPSITQPAAVDELEVAPVDALDENFVDEALIEDAEFEEEAAPRLYEDTGADALVNMEDHGRRLRRPHLILAVAALLIIVVIAASSGGPGPARKTTSTDTSGAPIVTFKPPPAKTTTATTPTIKTTGTPPPPSSARLGTPTNAEVMAAKHALDLAQSLIWSYQRAGALIGSTPVLQADLASRDSYIIHVLAGGTPRPFIGATRGDLSVTFATQAGFVLLQTAAGKLGIPQILEVKLLPQHKLIVPSDGMFTSGSAALNAAGEQFIRIASAQLGLAKTIRCVGYTDAQGTAASNLTLGLRRATAFCDQLKSAGTVATLSVATGGESHPIASNTTAAGRARNRRVELDATY